MALLCSLAALVAAAPAAAQQPTEKVVTSFDGTPIVTAFFSAADLAPGASAPTVLLGHGWGGSRATDPNSGRVGVLRRAGYNVLTWDARGFGQSGGTVSVDSPEFEGRDAQALIDYVATLPQARLDSAGDPRLGMSGGSYGGGIQWVTAAIDRRVDAIAPEIAWHSLVSSLLKDGSLKGGWGTLLFAAGVPTSIAPGINGPAGTQLGNLDPHITSAYASGIATGSVSEEDRRWFESRGPGALVNDVRVPTLIVQGTIDTLFTLEEAVTNYRILRANDVPVKMMWYCGGHGTCLTSSGPGGFVERAIVGWFDRHLKGDESVVTGPRFEWLSEDGVWRTAADYPLRDAGALTGTGSGPLPVTPVDYALSGGLLNGTVAPIAIEARVPASAGADVVGTPRLDLTYTGTAVPAQTFLYAQVVDPARDIVVGNQVTPLPVTLDGRERTVSRPLEGLASRAAASGYVVQVIGGSNVYGPQRSVGGITASRFAVTLPTVDAAATPDDVSGPGLPPPAAPPPAPAGQRRVRIGLAGPGGRASRVNRVLRVRVGTSDRLSDLALVLRDERGRRMGRGTRATLTGRRVVRILLSRRLRPGTYHLTAVASARDGSRVTVTRPLRFR